MSLKGGAELRASVLLILVLHPLMNEYNRGGGKVGRPVLAFHFPTARRGCGNVGIAQRFPKAVGAEGKPVFGFPFFHPLCREPVGNVGIA